MEKADTRLLEEWKANLDLLKFYETLKQQRFAHFLTIQTAFLAIFGLLAKEAIGVFSLVTMATLAVVPPQAAKTSAIVTASAASGDHFGDRCILILLVRPSAGHSVLPCPANRLGAVAEA